MRLLVTDITRDEIEPILDDLINPLREVFFGGKRDIPMSPRQRESMLKYGLVGLLDTCKDNTGKGTWKHYNPEAQEKDTASTHFMGVLPANGIFAFNDYIQGSGSQDSRDAFIGSIGGGNHFCELQTVDNILNGATAHAWGVKENAVTIMVHTGSVGLGHTVGGHFRDCAKAIWPKNLKYPENGFYPIPVSGQHAPLATKYLDAMSNAANFALGNRLFLGLMAIRVLSEVLGREIESRLIYDAPHNLIWSEEKSFVHRKGACPAIGPNPLDMGPFQYTGHPVIIPGSMGSASYLFAGMGNDSALCSACHGAGRLISRGKARHVDSDAVISKLRVVTPIDPTSSTNRMRRDVMQQHQDRLREESPVCYKDITPVVQTVEDASIAKRVARMWPLLTIKG